MYYIIIKQLKKCKNVQYTFVAKATPVHIIVNNVRANIINRTPAKVEANSIIAYPTSKNNIERKISMLF